MIARIVPLVLCLALTACPKPTSSTPTPVPPAATTIAATPAPAIATSAPVPGAAAGEKHRLRLSNWPKAPVTATLNGEWIGQWDVDASVPLTALKGKNDLLVEVGGDPKSDLHVMIEAERNNVWVSLISLNYKDKPGKHAAAFVAK